MAYTILDSITNLQHSGHFLMVVLCFFWGLITVVLSPCHLAAVPVMASPAVSSAAVKYKTQLFTFGYFLAVCGLGTVLIFFTIPLDLLGHFWTIPFGVLFLSSAWFAIRERHHSDYHTPPSGITSIFVARFAPNSTKRFISMGFVYGILSGACVVGFLAPLLFIALAQSFKLAFWVCVAFAVGHSLPMLLVGAIAHKLHDYLHHDERSNAFLFRVVRYIIMCFIIIVGLLLIAHPFVEMLGVDVHMLENTN